MKRRVMMAALKWASMFGAGIVLLDLLRWAWPGRSMFGFHTIHFIWLLPFGEGLEPMLRQRLFGQYTYNIVGTIFFAGLGGMTGGLSKAVALAVEAWRRAPAHAESWN